MAVVAQTALEEEVKARQQVEEKVVPPAGVRLKSLFFEEDFAGDPSIYVVYTVSKRLGLGRARIKLLQTLEQNVRKVLQNTISDRLIYTRFVDVR